MIDIIALFAFVGIFVYLIIWVIYIYMKNKSEIANSEDTPEWIEFKHGASFVILRWSEVDWFNKLSDKEKSSLVYEQGVLIKNGIIRIVQINGEKRLISNADYKKIK